MEFFRIKKDIPFMKHALVFNAISFLTFALAVFFLFTRGLHLSVEFTGGTLMEVSYSQAADLNKVRSTVAGLGFAETQIQNFGTARDVMIRLPAQKGVSSAQQSEKVMAALKADAPDVTLRRTEFVGPQVGDELMHDGLKALAFVVRAVQLHSVASTAAPRWELRPRACRAARVPSPRAHCASSRAPPACGPARPEWRAATCSWTHRRCRSGPSPGARRSGRS